MDRQYTSKDSDVIKFKNYAKDKAGHIRQIITISLEPIIFKDDEFDAVIKVNVAPYKGTDFKYNKYPYMDTLRRYHIEDGTLDNVEEDEGTILLDDTGGGFSQKWWWCFISDTRAIAISDEERRFTGCIETGEAAHENAIKDTDNSLSR
jgi:hypothetical protein